MDVSNKKLKDRAIRLISEICSLSYAEACFELHEALEELKEADDSTKERISPVQYTIKKIQGR